MPGISRVGFNGGFSNRCLGSDIERIHDGALRVLSRTGIAVHDWDTLALLDGAGCQVDMGTRHVRIPTQVVRDAVSHSPSVVNLYNRLGEHVMALGAGPLYARISSGATGILDLESGRRREPSSQDAADVVRLADALPHVHGVSTMAVQPADLPVTAIDVYTVKIALSNTVKPLGYVCLNEQLLDYVLEMVATVVGGEEALRQRPMITALAESTSPLKLVSSQLTVLRTFATRGLPLTLHAHPMAGLTAPVTLAGELVVTHAEVLALVTIAQLIRPGTPVLYGMSSSVPDMRGGINLSGAVEIGLLGEAVARLAKYCCLPCVMSSGTDAHRPGSQATMERLMTLLPPALAGMDLINLSTLETKMSFSMEQLVVDETILSLMEHYFSGIGVGDETLALDLIHEIGSTGAYITADHTVGHFRGELLIPELVGRETRSAWDAAGAPDMSSRARDKIHRILTEHHTPPLAAGVAVRLDEIVKEAEARSKQGEESR